MAKTLFVVSNLNFLREREKDKSIPVKESVIMNEKGN